MATLEERLQSILGQKDFAIASLGVQIEQLNAEIVILKKKLQEQEGKLFEVEGKLFESSEEAKAAKANGQSPPA